MLTSLNRNIIYMRDAANVAILPIKLTAKPSLVYFVYSLLLCCYDSFKLI